MYDDFFDLNDLIENFIFEGYMPQKYRDEIYHYTSSNASMSILSENSENLTLRASRYDCMNDYSEGTVAEEVYFEACNELLKQEKMSKELYDRLIGIKKDKEVMFFEKAENSFKVKYYEAHRFVCSFSKDDDALAMWNYYSKEEKSEGINLGVSSEEIEYDLNQRYEDSKIRVNIYPVIYKKEKQLELVLRMLDNILSIDYTEDLDFICNMISDQLTDWSLIFKKECFEHEKEVRLIVDIAKSTPIEIKYRNNYGYVIPFIVMNISKNVLLSVKIGPRYCDLVQKEKQKQVTSEMLKAWGYNAIVTHSYIPVRY